LEKVQVRFSHETNQSDLQFTIYDLQFARLLKFDRISVFSFYHKLVINSLFVLKYFHFLFQDISNSTKKYLYLYRKYTWKINS